MLKFKEYSLEKAWQLHTTADKRKIKDFLRFATQTSFTRRTLGEIAKMR